MSTKEHRMNKMRRQAARWMAVGTLAVLGCGPAAAQSDYPNRPIRLVLGSGAGDNTDLFARVLADELKDRLKQPVLVDNKPGAAGIVGGAHVAKAPADGYTLLFGQMSTLIVAPQVVHPMPYDTTRSFTPIVKTQQGGSIVAVHRNVPATTLAGLVQLAKAKPEQLVFAVNNLGSVQHLAMEIVQSRTGSKFNTVPYKGTAPALMAVVKGEADIVVAGALAAKPYIDSGVLRPLAVYGERGIPQYPNLPTIGAALNIPDVDHDFWYGVVGPAGLSKDVVAKLSTAIQSAMGAPRIVEMLQGNAQFFKPNSPEDFGKEIAAQWSTFGRIARDNKLEMK